MAASEKGHPCLEVIVIIGYYNASFAWRKPYAQQHNPDHSQCTFVLGDIRHAAFGGPYDLAMMLFGEFNVFSPSEASAILRKVRASLRPEGRLIIETQTPEAVEQAGHSELSEQQCESGLFSDQTFSVTETANDQTPVYRSTTRAWSDHDLMELLTEAGFHEAAPYDQWPCNTDTLRLWVARVK